MMMVAVILVVMLMAILMRTRIIIRSGDGSRAALSGLLALALRRCVLSAGGGGGGGRAAPGRAASPLSHRCLRLRLRLFLLRIAIPTAVVSVVVLLILLDVIRPLPMAELVLDLLQLAPLLRPSLRLSRRRRPICLRLLPLRCPAARGRAGSPPPAAWRRRSLLVTHRALVPLPFVLRQRGRSAHLRWW